MGKLLNKVFGRVRLNFKKINTIAAITIVTAAAGLVGTNLISTSKVDAADCSGNSIIKCGAQSRTNFINDVKKSSELQHVYDNFGLTSADYSRFISSAKPGLAYRNSNTIVVDGKVVATNVGSIGRWASYQGSGYRTFSIKGAGTYYGNLNAKSISASSPSLPVQVLFDSNGKMQFAVMMTTCANPTYGSPTTPPTCKDLNATALGNNQWRFTTTITAGTDKETVNKVVYNFGDGTTATSTKAPYTVNHTFTKGETVTATVYTNVPGGGTAASSTCSKAIPFKPVPVAACEDLKALVSDRTKVALTARATVANGASISDYQYVVKDTAGHVVANPTVKTAGGTATANINVATAGTYTAQVTVSTSLGAETANACKTSFTITPALTPNVTITKHVDNTKLEQVAVGQHFVYELVVTNTGTQDLKNVAVTDPAPTGVTMISADLGTIVNNAWSYIIPSLPIGASKTFNITADVAQYIAGNIVNTACVNAPEVNPTQPTQPDACDTATVTVIPLTPKNPNITITKTVDGQKQEQVATNQNFVYQLVITNTGEIDLTNVAVADPAPAGVTITTADLGTIANNAFSYTIPSLAVGQSVTVNITGHVAQYIAGNIVNTACVNAPEVNPTQPTQPDACDTATVTVIPLTPTPTALPNTGAGDVIGVTLGAIIAGTVVGRLYLSRRVARLSN